MECPDVNGGETKEPSATPRGRKLTAHAQESLPRHGFSAPFGQIDDIIEHATRVAKQADGAMVYIQKAGPRGKRYNIVVEGDEGIVTAIRGLTRSELDQLGRHYGFDPAP